MKRLIVNYENNATDFWDNEGGKLWEELCGGEWGVQDIALPDEEADTAMERFARCFGWKSDDFNGQPDPSNLPILVQKIED